MSGLYPERHAVAAVGLVQGMGGVYDLKDVIAFHAGDMDRVADACGLYFQEVSGRARGRRARALGVPTGLGLAAHTGQGRARGRARDCRLCSRRRPRTS